jgi:hypothetical protein
MPAEIRTAVLGPRRIGHDAQRASVKRRVRVIGTNRLGNVLRYGAPACEAQ